MVHIAVDRLGIISTKLRCGLPLAVLNESKSLGIENVTRVSNKSDCVLGRKKNTRVVILIAE